MLTCAFGQMDAQTKRFLFMYYGKQLDIKYFMGKFGVFSVEGTTDDRGCHFIFLKTCTRIRTSQLFAAINEYNLKVPSSRTMRLQEEPYQPAIVTMSSKKMEGSIYSKILQDRNTKGQGCKSNFWFWEQGLSNTDQNIESDIREQIKEGEELHHVVGNDYIKTSRIQFIEIQASKKHPLLVEQLFNPEMLAEVEKWDLIEQTLKEDHNEDEFEPACIGSVYFASTPTLPGILKIGGTKFDGETRVRQLYTAGVPERYTCQFDFKCPDWKLFEGVVHEITKASRVYKRKEFFFMQPAAAAKLIDQIIGIVPRTYDEQLNWDSAFNKVVARLQRSRAKWAKIQAKRPREEDWAAGPSRAQMAAAMDKLTEENALLITQHRARPAESTE